MIAVSVSGEDTVARGLGTLTAQLDNLAPAFVNLDAEVEAAATPLVPVLTSRLADSLEGRVERESYEWGTDVEYAVVQSYGWSAHGIEPHGFIQAAEDVLEARATENIEDLLTATARRAGLV